MRQPSGDRGAEGGMELQDRRGSAWHGRADVGTRFTTDNHIQRHAAKGDGVVHGRKESDRVAQKPKANTPQRCKHN